MVRVGGRLAAALLLIGVWAMGAESIWDRLEKKRAPKPAAPASANSRKLHRGVLIFKAESGSGSGFYAKLDGRLVIVTNAHVFLRLATPKIYDLAGGECTIQRVLLSRTRDLAILLPERTGPGAELALEIHPGIGELRIESPVMALGNSLGDQVVTELTGRLLGIGPEQIEIDAPIVPGNSGGPVVESGSGKVVGVATYLKVYADAEDAARTSRFFGSRFNPVVRRFATRIDNLDPEDLQELNLAELAAERRVFQLGETLLEELAQSAREWRTLPEAVRGGEAFLQARCEELRSWERHGWKSEFLRRDFERRHELFRRVVQQLGLAGWDARMKINELWTQALGRIQERPAAAPKSLAGTCPKCRGSGEIAIRERNPAYNRNVLSSPRELVRRVRCSDCEEAPVSSPARETKVYVLPEALEAELARQVSPAAKPFGGIYLGGEMNRPPQNTLLKCPLIGTARDGVFYLLAVRGNPGLSAAARTVVEIACGRVLRVVVLLPADSGSSLAETDSYLQAEFKDPELCFRTGVREQLLELEPGNGQRYLVIEAVHDLYPAFRKLSMNNSRNLLNL